jgi:hypothetical protein
VHEAKTNGLSDARYVNIPEVTIEMTQPPPPAPVIFDGKLNSDVNRITIDLRHPSVSHALRGEMMRIG